MYNIYPRVNPYITPLSQSQPHLRDDRRARRPPEILRQRILALRLVLVQALGVLRQGSRPVGPKVALLRLQQPTQEWPDGPAGDQRGGKVRLRSLLATVRLDRCVWVDATLTRNLLLGLTLNPTIATTTSTTTTTTTYTTTVPGALGGHKRFCDAGAWRCGWCACK